MSKLIGTNKFQIGDLVSFQRYGQQYCNGKIIDLRVKLKAKVGIRLIQYKVEVPSLKSKWISTPVWWFNENEIVKKVNSFEDFYDISIDKSLTVNVKKKSFFQKLKSWVVSVLK